MGKHEKQEEKSFLDKACEVEDAIKSLESDGVLGFLSMGIHLYSEVFLANFETYTLEDDGDNFALVSADYKGHRFIACLRKEET